MYGKYQLAATMPPMVPYKMTSNYPGLQQMSHSLMASLHNNFLLVTPVSNYLHESHCNK